MPDAQTDESLDPLGFDSPTALSRLGKLEAELRELTNTLLGDQVAIAKYKRAVETYVTPRGPEPPHGLLMTMQGQIESITKMVLDAREKLLELDSAVTEVEAAVENIRKTPGDADQIATRGFVDEGLARLSRALRGELLPDHAQPGDRLVTRVYVDAVVARLSERIDAVRPSYEERESRYAPSLVAQWMSLRVGLATIADGLGKKARRRIRKAMPAWFASADERTHPVLEEIEEAVR